MNAFNIRRIIQLFATYVRRVGIFVCQAYWGFFFFSCHCKVRWWIRNWDEPDWGGVTIKNRDARHSFSWNCFNLSCKPMSSNMKNEKDFLLSPTSNLMKGKTKQRNERQLWSMIREMWHRAVALETNKVKSTKVWVVENKTEFCRPVDGWIDIKRGSSMCGNCNCCKKQGVTLKTFFLMLGSKMWKIMWEKGSAEATKPQVKERAVKKNSMNGFWYTKSTTDLRSLKTCCYG